jgi:hypothetical protein
MARAVKRLTSQIPFPGPDVDASVFEVDEIWKFVEENAREIRAGSAKDLISVSQLQVSRQDSYSPSTGEGSIKPDNGL